MGRLLSRGTVFAFTILLLMPAFMIHAGPPAVDVQPSVPSTPPPTITISDLSPNPAQNGDLIWLNFTATDAYAPVTATWIDWGDGSTPDLILNDTSPSMCQSSNPGLNTNACTIAQNSLIFAQPQNPSAILNGSIIAFTTSSNSGFLILHRVIGIVAASLSIYNMVSFRTKGDANPGPDCLTPNCYIPSSWVVAVYQYTLAPVKQGSGARYDTHTYPSLGNAPETYDIRLNATDITGLSTSLTMTLTVDNQPPTARITSISSNSNSTRTTVTVSFSSSDPDGTIYSIQISWGDGTNTTLTGSETSSVHVYSAPGTYTISVVATDNSGSTSQPSTQTFTVSSPSSQVTTLPTLFGLGVLLFYAIITGAVLVGVVTILALTMRPKKRT